jgi:hypothetical protein
MVPGDENVPQHLIEAADAGLYQAKRRGRNNVAVESPGLVPDAAAAPAPAVPPSA